MRVEFAKQVAVEAGAIEDDKFCTEDSMTMNETG